LNVGLPFDAQCNREANQGINIIKAQDRDLVAELSVSERADIVRIFWTSPCEALFPPEVTAVVTERTTGTLEKLRSVGDGPEFRTNGRVIQYAKGDIVKWLEKTTVSANNASAARALLAKLRGPLSSFGASR
jgi:hypothetical protein